MILGKQESPRLSERGCLWQPVPPQPPPFILATAVAVQSVQPSPVYPDVGHHGTSLDTHMYGPTNQGASLAALTSGEGSGCVNTPTILISSGHLLGSSWKSSEYHSGNVTLTLRIHSCPGFLFFRISMFPACKTLSLLSGELRLWQPVLGFQNKIIGCDNNESPVRGRWSRDT